MRTEAPGVRRANSGPARRVETPVGASAPGRFRVARAVAAGPAGGEGSESVSARSGTPPTGPGGTEQELIRRVAAGDHAAFRSLVGPYQGRVFGLALRVLRDEDRARDAVQDAMLKVYRSIRRFEGRSSFYTWFYRMVLNTCIDLKRRDRSDREVEWEEGRALEAEARGDVLAGAPVPPEDPEEAASRAELRGVLARAIEELPEGARETLLLREVDGLSYAEIAEALEIPKGTVMSRLHYARRRLRDRLRAAGVEQPGAPGGAPPPGETAGPPGRGVARDGDGVTP